MSRLQPYQYLQNQGLYSALSLRQLVQELSQLRTDVGQIHSQMNNAKTQKLFEEVKKKKIPHVSSLIPHVYELVLGYNLSAADLVVMSVWQVDGLGKYVERLQTADIINMKTVQQKLRYLKNSAESCRTIPQDFRGHYFYTFRLYCSVLAHRVAGVCQGTWLREEQGQILATVTQLQII